MSVPPERTVTVSAIAPVPVAVQVEPAVAAHVQEAVVIPDGSGSETVAPTASEGPAFETTIV